MIPRKVMFEEDHQKLVDHFIWNIKDEDRYLRFGITRSDDSVKNYIDASLLNFGYENMWFVIEHNDQFVATVHVNVNDKGVAEMGFTVSPTHRNQGHAQQLFYRGATWASMKGAKTIYTHCLSRNKVMQHIAKKNGMQVVTLDEGEKEATIQVSKSIIKSYYEDATLDNIAFVDRAVGKQQHMITTLLRL